MPPAPCPTALAAALAAAFDRGPRSVEARCVRDAPGLHRLLLRLGTAPLLGPPLRHALDRHLGGTLTHLRARKAAFAATARSFLATHRGATRLVQLGAGLCGLASRLVAAHPRLHAVEIDRAPVIRHKLFALRGTPAQRRLRWLALDLAAPPPARLALPGSLPLRAPTLVLAEGLFMYLPELALTAWLATLAAGCPGPLVIVGTWLDSDRLSPAAGATRAARHLRRRGAPQFLWSATAAALAPRLEHPGLQVSFPELWDGAYGERAFRVERVED